jgi:hypothetical protein
MKKGQILFFAIFCTSAIGGGFAYKIKNAVFGKYCYSVTDMNPIIGECTMTANFTTFRPLLLGEPIVYYTTTLDLNQCMIANCPFIGAQGP